MGEFLQNGFVIRDQPPLLPDAHYYEYREVRYPYSTVGEFPLLGRRGLERYLSLLPMDTIRVALPGQPSPTPLSRAMRLGQSVGLNNLWVKHEETNPTGSFKDRESAIVISLALERGITRVNILSSGNAAISTAAYAQRAGIECVCYVPEDKPGEKLALIRLFGGKLITAPGIYEDMYKQVVDENPPGWNVTSGQNEFRMEGAKTIAFEIWEQLDQVPDVIVVPTGAGSCVAAIWKGFVELKQIGKIAKLPKMIAVQPKGGAPIAHALRTGKDYVVLGTFDESIADGLAAEESFCSPKAVQALRESRGDVIEVSDPEIIEALRNVIRLESFLPEPSTAAAYAALSKLQYDDLNTLVVVINTGSGTKMASEIEQLLLRN